MQYHLQTKLSTLKAYTLIAAALFVSTNVMAQTKKFVLNNATNPLKSFAVQSGKESHPFFVDIDNDGDLDCFSGEFNYNGKGNAVSNIYFFKNDGSNVHPIFKPVIGNDNALSKVSVAGLASPHFVDIDADGDYDCFIGDNSGALRFYKNVGTASHAVFEKQSASGNPLLIVKYGDFEFAEPSFADVDGDGDFDCLVTDKYGNESFYKNVGTAEKAGFKQVTSSADPFNFLLHKEVAGVSLYDWNKDGRTDLFVGNTYYKNTGTATTPSFTRSTENAPDLSANSSALPTRWVDLNNDGSTEVITGTSTGNFDFLTVSSVTQKTMLELKAYPNPSKDQFRIYLPNNTNTETVIRITDAQGKIISAQKTNGNTVTFGKELKTGAYFLQVLQNDKEVYSQKLIKE